MPWARCVAQAVSCGIRELRSRLRKKPIVHSIVVDLSLLAVPESNASADSDQEKMGRFLNTAYDLLPHAEEMIR